MRFLSIKEYWDVVVAVWVVVVLVEGNIDVVDVVVVLAEGETVAVDEVVAFVVEVTDGVDVLGGAVMEATDVVVGELAWEETEEVGIVVVGLSGLPVVQPETNARIMNIVNKKAFLINYPAMLPNWVLIN